MNNKTIDITNAELVMEDIIDDLIDFYDTKPITMFDDKKQVPSVDEVNKIIDDLKKIVFPSYFSQVKVNKENAHEHLKKMLFDLDDKLNKQIRLAMLFCKKQDCDEKHLKSICDQFIGSIPKLQNLILKDARMIFDGDPSAVNLEEIIISYPGFYAIFVYRFAHALYQLKVPIIPRMMTELAHSKTGIDINPGAVIGDNFFIDHGTGVVIGETAVIGDYVKIYQGVTLGALSTHKGQLLAGVKRHPTLKDNVTIYANATILGGETVIGRNVVIGGNTFITSSVADGIKVSIKKPELEFTEFSKK